MDFQVIFETRIHFIKEHLGWMDVDSWRLVKRLQNFENFEKSSKTKNVDFIKNFWKHNKTCFFFLRISKILIFRELLESFRLLQNVNLL